MTSYVALLYSIAIADNRRLVMSDWRAMMAGIGLQNPRTLIATGNAVFDSRGRTIRQLETQLEDAFADRFGRRVDTIVRTAASWQRLTAGNPFPDESARDGARVAVRVMREPLTTAAAASLKAYARPGERFEVVNGDVWIYEEPGLTRPRLVPALTPGRFGIGTIRNWNTVRRLNDLLG